MQAQYYGPSFRAIDDRGGDHTLTPAYHAKDASKAGAQPSYALADCVGLMTAEGRAVTRIGKGRYVITDPDPGRQVLLSSDDPHAT